MDDQLELLLETLQKVNPYVDVIRTPKILDVRNDSYPVVTIDLDERRATFHGEYPQNAPFNPELQPLVAHLDREGYEMNLD